MRIAREEIFGPVLSVLTFRTPDEAVAKANNTPYGLSAGVWTEKGSRILGMAAALRAGVVWANTFNRFDPTAAFGGYKESGFGREGGRSGLGAYLNTDDDGAVAAIGAPVEARRSVGRRRGAGDRSRGLDASCLMRLPSDGAMLTCRTGSRAKTYKLYVGGAFPRSESGRTYPATGGSGGSIMANVAQGSRKDARDAVVAARKAFRGWSGATAYNRGQVIYRIAEMLEGRRAAVRRPARRAAPSDAGRGRRRDRPTGALRRLDRQAGRRLRWGQSRCRAVLLVLHPGADRGGRGDRAAAGSAARAGRR